MTNKSENPQQTGPWETAFVVGPVVSLYFLARELFPESLVYGALGAMVGTGLGLGASFLVRNQSKLVKTLAAVGLIVGILGITALIAPTATDAQLIEQEWVEQSIGLLEFETPIPLEQISIDIPDSISSFVNKMNAYSDNQEGRMTYLVDYEFKTDTLSLEKGFAGALQFMMDRHGDNAQNLQFEDSYQDEEEIFGTISFELDGKPVKGYGHAVKDSNAFTTIWLFPITRGFSEDYVDWFSDSVFPIY